MSGSMGLSKSESDSQNQNQFQQNVWSGQAPYLESMYGQAGDLYGATNPNMQAGVPSAASGMQGVADSANPAWQNQLQGGAYRDMGLQNTFMDSMNNSLNNPSAMQDINAMIMGGSGNNYADAMRDQYTQDAQRAMDLQNSTLDQRAALSGQSGSSRHGVAQALGNENITDNLQTQLANTGYNTFDKDLDRKLQIANQADQGTLARQGMMGNMIGEQQGAMQSGLGMAPDMQGLSMAPFAAYQAPWTGMQNYSNAIGGPTVLGSGSGSGDASSKGYSQYGSASYGGGGGK